MSENKNDNPYEDMIHLSHHVSQTHPQMSIYDRAAQFSPFAALTGHDAAIKETARRTDQRIELDESEKQLLDERLQRVRKEIGSHPDITFTYFVPDEKKVGGTYQTLIGKIKKLDEYNHVIYLENGERIPIDEIIGMEGELFKALDETLG